IKTYIPDGDFAIRDKNGNKIEYTVVDAKDLTSYILSQTIKLDPSRQFYIPEKVLEATIAIKTEKVPSLGYTQYSVDTTSNSRAAMEKLSDLENEYYKITVESDGSLTILDKENGKIYDNQAILVE